MEWLANLVTGGEHRRLGLNAKHLREAYADSEDRVERLTEDLVAAKNALAEVGTERDGLLEQADTLNRNASAADQQRNGAVANCNRLDKELTEFRIEATTAARQRDVAREKNERYAATLRGFESDRALVLAHAVRLYAMVCEATDYGQEVWRQCDLVAAQCVMLARHTNRLLESNAAWNRRHDAATVRAEAMRREVERQRGVIATLRAKRDEARQNAYDQPRDKKGRFTRSGAQKRKDQANGRRRK